MKIKLGEIKVKHQALCGIVRKNLPARLSYAIGKNILKLEGEFKELESARHKLAEQYAKKDENGNLVIENGKYVFGDNEEIFDKEYKDLLDMEVEIDILTLPVNIIDSFEDTRYDAPSPLDMISIDFMLVNPQEAVIEDVEPRD